MCVRARVCSSVECVNVSLLAVYLPEFLSPISLHVCMRCPCASLTHSHPHAHSLPLSPPRSSLPLHTISPIHTHNLTQSHAHAAGNNGNIIIAAARRLVTVGELEAASPKKKRNSAQETYEMKQICSVTDVSESHTHTHTHCLRLENRSSEFPENCAPALRK